jgi:AGCS family alanine or glycine:cation symporter
MYYMKKRLNLKLPSGKVIKTGSWLAIIFAVATIFSSFGTGNLPQINSISNSLFETFEIPHILTGGILSLLMGFVILGGIKRIAKVTQTLVPVMAVIYIIPSIQAIASGVFTGSSATGGFLGASVAFAFNRGVNRGLFSNEAGQGSAPIAHAAARAHEPVSEGLVALLEPFIDTIIICMLTGLTLMASGVWSEKFENRFQMTDMEIVEGHYTDKNQEILKDHLSGQNTLPLFSGDMEVVNGTPDPQMTILHARSVAEEVNIYQDGNLFTGAMGILNGQLEQPDKYTIEGKSLLHSAPLTTVAFSRSWLGEYGKYIVSIGLLLFAFSTAISWSYYGGRAVTFLFGIKGVIWYKGVYIIGFFLASFTDTTIVWILSGITIALMTIPNLIGLLFLHKEVKQEVLSFWKEYNESFPEENAPNR